MKGASSNVAHEYDPNLVFRNYTANIPHLKSWVDDLVKLTETSLPQTSTPNTDTLVNALQRYDVVFKELLRQTTIFSEPIAEMLAKAWSGALRLLMYMIKSYHRYVKQTSHLQDQAQSLLAERIKDEAATKVQKEEFEM